MVTMAQRIEELRTQKGISRPALSAALALPRTAAEKFETGRQTPSQDQQKKLAEYFGVSLHYLRGESDDPEQMETWLNGGALTQDEPTVSVPRPAVKAKPKPAAVQEDGAVFGALLKSTVSGHDPQYHHGGSPLPGRPGAFDKGRPAGTGAPLNIQKTMPELQAVPAWLFVFCCQEIERTL